MIKIDTFKHDFINLFLYSPLSETGSEQQSLVSALWELLQIETLEKKNSSTWNGSFNFWALNELTFPSLAFQYFVINFVMSFSDFILY